MQFLLWKCALDPEMMRLPWGNEVAIEMKNEMFYGWNEREWKKFHYLVAGTWNETGAVNEWNKLADQVFLWHVPVVHDVNGSYQSCSSNLAHFTQYQIHGCVLSRNHDGMRRWYHVAFFPSILFLWSWLSREVSLVLFRCVSLPFHLVEQYLHVSSISDTIHVLAVLFPRETFQNLGLSTIVNYMIWRNEWMIKFSRVKYGWPKTGFIRVDLGS